MLQYEIELLFMIDLFPIYGEIYIYIYKIHNLCVMYMSLYTYKQNFHTYTINTYMHIHTCIYVHTDIYTHTYMCVHIHACMHTHTFLIWLPVGKTLGLFFSF